jgi:hypothetical protein
MPVSYLELKGHLSRSRNRTSVEAYCSDARRASAASNFPAREQIPWTFVRRLYSQPMRLKRPYSRAHEATMTSIAIG